jgi:flagellin-like protein
MGNCKSNMKMTIGHSHGRKAISPVIATVILIAITLIAAIAIAGFVFGLFSTNTNQANLSILGTVSCSSGVCTLTVQNSGALAGEITGVGPSTFTEDATGCAGVAFTSGSCAVAANSQVAIKIDYTTTGQVTGYLTQSNGPQLTFTAVLQ